MDNALKWRTDIKADCAPLWIDALPHGVTILGITEAVGVFAFEQDADECVKKMQELGSRLKRERVNHNSALT